MISAAQIRAARALLRWPAKKLAETSRVSVPTVQRMEATEGVPSGLSRNLEALQNALEEAGVIFIDENGGGAGVRLRQPD